MGSGDVPTSAAYHADLTFARGSLRLAGRTTSIIGQNAPITGRCVGNIFPSRPSRRLRAHDGKETQSSGSARGPIRTGTCIFSNHACRPSVLRDGQPVWEFMRSNPTGQAPAEVTPGRPWGRAHLEHARLPGPGRGLSVCSTPTSAKSGILSAVRRVDSSGARATGRHAQSAKDLRHDDPPLAAIPDSPGPLHVSAVEKRRPGRDPDRVG